MLIGSSCDVAHSHIAFTVLLVAMAEWIAEEAPPEQSVPFPQLVKTISASAYRASTTRLRAAPEEMIAADAISAACQR